jgi:N-acetylmuramic acid 6-phosphate etherase
MMPFSKAWDLPLRKPPPDNSLGTAAALIPRTVEHRTPAAAIIEEGLMRRLRPARTEQRNSRSSGLDRRSSLAIVRALNREDAQVARAVRKVLPQIARAVDVISKSLRRGGTLFYVGAGTSGRLVVLDAAECPPTFGTPPKMVRAIIAGGERALRHAVEGAEDSAVLGARDLRRAGLTNRDVVVGVAASGATPYVLGALAFAKQQGAVTIGLTSNAGSPVARTAAISIAADTGPEAIAGSTRLKAGTAQKMVLNMLSTASMVRIGRVYENWMVYVTLTNDKLRRRGAQILKEAAKVSASAAEHALRRANHNLPAALVMLKSGASLRDAKRSLAATGGNVRLAIQTAARDQAGLTGRK